MRRKLRALIIAYHFPPESVVQVQRVTRFVHYLPEYGIEPIVIAPEPQAINYPNDSLLRLIPATTEVIRIRAFDPLRMLFAVRDSWARLRGGGKTGGRTLPASNDEVRAQSFAKLAVTFLLIPDPAALWARTALKKSLRLLAQERIDVIFSSSPPYSAHILGNRLRRITGLPHLVDLRDSWCDNPYVQQPTSIHYRYARRLESRVFSECDHIVCVTQGMQAEIRRHYPNVMEDKLSVIPNGFEEADFEGEVDRERSLFHVRHVGSALLASGRSVLPLLQGFMSFINSRPQAGEQARLTIVGDMDAGNRRLYDAFLSQENAAGLIRTTGRVSPAEAIKLTRSADLLVIIVGMQVDSKTRRLTDRLDTTSMTGKVFEYLASGNPILVLAEQGEVAELVRGLDAGSCCNPSEATQIARAIESAYDDWRAGGLKQRPLTDAVRRYSRRRQAGSLAERLWAIADDPLIRARRFSRTFPSNLA